MKSCPRCNTQMQKRGGPYGPFWFCPNQASCNQKTLSAKINWESTRTGRYKSVPSQPADRATIDNADIVFGGMFCDMGQDFDDDLGMG